MEQTTSKLSSSTNNTDERVEQEIHHFLKYLPKEIWKIIAKGLQPSDRQRVINSSPFFRNLLLGKQVLLLYQPVMKILLPIIAKVNIENKVLSQLFSTCQQKGEMKPFILSNRLVCKTWKRTIDKMASIWIENEPTSLNGLVAYLISSDHLKFTTGEMITQFLGNLQDTHSTAVNPFIGNSISITPIIYRGSLLLFNDKLCQLLERYGEHVLNCNISLHWRDEPPMYSILLHWLTIMPNLKNLRIYCNSSWNLDHVGDPCNLQAIKMKSLEHVVIENMPCQFIELFMEKNLHVNKLEIYVHATKTLQNTNYLEQLVYFENLQTLGVTIRDWHDLKNVCKVKSKSVEVLRVDVQGSENDLPWCEIFVLLSDIFSLSLEALVIEFPGANWQDKDSVSKENILNDSLNCRLNLSKVRKLEVKMSDNASLDFILGVQKTLQDLTITYTGSWNATVETAGCKQLITFFWRDEIEKRESKVLRSNIWELVPKLKTVCIFNQFSNWKRVYKRP